jgi:putative SOS response-associated peptidase YedK
VLAADYNVAPTKKVYAVMDRRPRGAEKAGRPVASDNSPSPSASEPGDASGSGTGDGSDGSVRRELAVVRWGLVPSWAKDPSIGSRMINARMETVAEKPAFRRAFAKRRCLLPADGYYEWYTPESGPKGANGKPLKQPFYIHPADGGVLAMAGLYELWRDPTREDGDPHAWLMSATVLTTTAEDAVGMIHDRMPLFVERERWSDWLDPTLDGSTRDLTELLVPAAPGRLDAYPVSTAVNNVRNNGPELVEPVAAEEPDAGALF